MNRAYYVLFNGVHYYFYTKHVKRVAGDFESIKNILDTYGYYAETDYWKNRATLGEVGHMTDRHGHWLVFRTDSSVLPCNKAEERVKEFYI